METHQDADPQAQHYRYRQLEFPDSIRMMALLPGHDGDDLRICLFQVRRSKVPVYKALSYTWGDAALVCDVHEILSGNTVSITKSLEAALRALRHETDTCTFWVDAICIDQTNVDERGHQVSMMGDIFQSAKIVVIWLGECTGEAEEEVDAINALADIQRERIDPDAGLCDATPYSILALAQDSALAYAGFSRRQKARKVDATSISLPGVAVDEIATTTHFSGYLDSANDGWRNYDGPSLSAFELTWAPVITYLSKHSKMLNPAVLDELQKPRECRLQQLESRAAKIEGREAEIDPGLMNISQESYMSRILADQGDDELFETGFWSRELNDESARWIASSFDAHSIFETKLGYLGIGPTALRSGDQVVIFDRGVTPFVLREAAHPSTSEQKRWRLVGDAYLLGWMDGDYNGCKVVDEDVDNHNAAKRREAGAEKDSKDAGDPLRPRVLIGTSFVLC
ncbi:hypothetical protein E8E11_004158 [Didymella keratinophila]|nr:hypothetical protein E8E11_004158 [Didymella keratinophila]